METSGLNHVNDAAKVSLRTLEPLHFLGMRGVETFFGHLYLSILLEGISSIRIHIASAFLDLPG